MPQDYHTWKTPVPSIKLGTGKTGKKNLFQNDESEPLFQSSVFKLTFSKSVQTAAKLFMFQR